MNGYLLDTNICIYFIKGLYELNKKISAVGFENFYISEITIAELKFGIENSKSSHKSNNRKVIESFINSVKVVPIISCLDIYAKEKARLRKTGKVVDDFDLLIGSSAIVNNLILVTRNESHFENLQNIKIENWINENN
jgi:tRNA(fMet)-specific endonuclease VapC